MAGTNKFAGLPDLDLAPEIYETAPDLTEASTLPTESDAVSDDDNPDLVRHVLNPDAARARFEPTLVDARSVNFSDTINGGRQDYRIRSRRRRRRAARAEEEEKEYWTDDGEEETLQARLARLKREAIELQDEIDKIERNNDKTTEEDAGSDDEDTVDNHSQLQQQSDLSRGIAELNTTLAGVRLASQRKKGLTLEEEFTQRLNANATSKSVARAQPSAQGEPLAQSSISAIAAFSDRLTTLETTLGISSLSNQITTSASASGSVLPTLDALHSQIETLYSTLAPRPEPVISSSSTQSIPTTSTVHLDPISAKLRLLISESKKLDDSRRAATKSFEELIETRDRNTHIFDASHTHSAVHSGTEPRLSRNASSQDINGRLAPESHEQNSASKKDEMQQRFTGLFLDDQARKIEALYNLLPTIQSLQPLLPVVLERLRALSVMHTGAADVRSELDEVENRLQIQEADVKKWREAVDNAEKAMQEGKEVMRENVQVVGDAVRGLENRVKGLK